jgi:site-specific DNA-methyltransferase (adenine-specific)
MIELFNIDCMTYMATLPDKFFDLAIVDPPYGIGMDGQIGSCRVNTFKKQDQKKWDSKRPLQQYWDELYGISKNQIIFGANYFTKFLPKHPSMGWIFWDKQIGGNFSEGEFIYTSFDRAAKKIHIPIEKNRVSNNSQKAIQYQRIHPTQKPVQLYKWLLKNYATPDMKIIDTHLGSGSLAIAAYDFGCDFVGCEIDKEYFDAAVKRYNIHIMQKTLF